MYVITSLNPRNKEKGNSESSGDYANYISKETDGLLFNSQLDYIKSDLAAQHIDKHSSGGIRKGESKWYSPTYCLSTEECLHIVSKVIEFGTVQSRRIIDFDQLTKSEQIKYNYEIQKLTLEFQRQMAVNFNKQDIGIKDEHDIVWYGSIEHVRQFKGYDRQVKNNHKIQGERKPGFHTHIHILQSRKANNEKKSLISPQANARIKTHQNAGFDRNIFYNRIESTFDSFTSFERSKQRTFEYFKKKKKESVSEQNVSQDNMRVDFKTKPSYIPKTEIKNILKNSNCIQYFFSLTNKNQFILKEKKGNSYVFQDVNNPKSVYFVSKSGWHNPYNNLSGGIINAIKDFELLDWNQTIQHIRYMNNVEFDNTSISVRNNQSSIQYAELKNLKNIIYLKQYGLFDINSARKYLKENHENQNVNLHLKNDSQGWNNVVNNSCNGKNDILTIEQINSNTYNLFNSILDFLEFKQKNPKAINAIILNSQTNLNKALIRLSGKNVINHTSLNLSNYNSKLKK